MTTAGYSGTPLPKKLGIKPDALLALVDAPRDFDTTLGPLPEGVVRTSLDAQPVDLLIVFYTDAATLRETFADRAKRIVPAGAFWVAWPKRSSGVPTDLTEDVLREVGLPVGMVDNKVCAIDGTWSGLRFVVRKENRAAWPGD